MESATSISSNPRTVEEIFKDFKGRRAAIARALTTDVDKFYSLCDPEKENLCLYGYPNDTWKVDLPVEEVPPELPEPALGINFARDGMQKRDWLSLVAVHSDSWLLAVAYYHGAQINHNDRKRLFSMINDLPTVFELVRKQAREKTNVEHGGNKSKVSGKRMNDGQIKNSKSISLKEDDETYDDDDEEHSDAMCGICGESYSGNEFWIMCDVCDRWYHGKCVKVTAAKAQSIKQYKCPPCSSKKVR